jgi:hypothetical protein
MTGPGRVGHGTSTFQGRDFSVSWAVTATWERELSTPINSMPEPFLLMAVRRSPWDPQEHCALKMMSVLLNSSAKG